MSCLGRSFRFKAHQSVYVKISAKTLLVIEIQIERVHIERLNQVLDLDQLFLILKPRLIKKLKNEFVGLNSIDQNLISTNESGGRTRGRLDIFRSNSFQMAFYFDDNRVNPHSILKRVKNQRLSEETDQELKPSEISTKYQSFSIFSKNLILV
ncbi:hypothetical protein BY996DRAFT_7008344 [Phakopsora pachyrhizi]|nr:hypothetical protein BY996DRAFT_7008344 [Phakopsora pachyrhizi]